MALEGVYMSYRYKPESKLSRLAGAIKDLTLVEWLIIAPIAAIVLFNPIVSRTTRHTVPNAKVLKTLIVKSHDVVAG
jgi:hypothetical protein